MVVHLQCCARPEPRIGARSAYTVLGFAGYVAATVLGCVLAILWELSLVDRVVALFGPPIAFIVTVTIATAAKGREWIVFYQAAVAAVALVGVVGLVLGTRVARLLDITVLGIGAFLVLGRIGCHRVACCHGRPARWGVVYGGAHVAMGFWSAWAGRPLVPVQLVESAVSLVLVLIASAASEMPGRAAVIYTTGYALSRFVIEIWRGDFVRPFTCGLSEAQCWSVAASVACALAFPIWWTTTAATLLALAAVALVLTRKHRELQLPPHLHELHQLCAESHRPPSVSGSKRATRLGVAVTSHALPDGRVDFLWSTDHPAWSLTTAESIARALWDDVEVVAGRSPGLVHVIVARP